MIYVYFESRSLYDQSISFPIFQKFSEISKLLSKFFDFSFLEEIVTVNLSRVKDSVSLR